MRVNVRPIVERAGGTVVKFEADNCFARFVDTAPAIDAAIAINRALDDLNRTTRDELDIRVSIGIDYGPILLVETPDYFGEAVNLASKLGEDLAQAGEILVSERAMRRTLIRFASLAFIAFAVAACDDSSAEILKKTENVSTRDELRAAIGDPDDITKVGPIETWTYNTSNGTVTFTLAGDSVTLKTTGSKAE